MYRHWLSIPFLLIVLALTGCGSLVAPTDGEQENDQTKQSNSPTPSVMIPSATIMSPSTLKAPTNTTLEGTIAPGGIQTTTPRPTFPPDQVRQLLIQYYSDNNDCQLPCWWGFSPGKSSWDETESILSQMGFVFAGNPSIDGFEVYDDVVLLPHEVFQQSNRVEDEYVLHRYLVKADTVQIIEVITRNIPLLGISNVLQAYGIPDEVRVFTFSSAREGDRPFDIVIYYQKGIMVLYEGQGTGVNGKVRGCPTSNLALAVWAPDLQYSFEEITEKTLNFRQIDRPYKSLMEATGIDEETFYGLFEGLPSTECLETPSEIWPPPG